MEILCNEDRQPKSKASSTFLSCVTVRYPYLVSVSEYFKRYFFIAHRGLTMK